MANESIGLLGRKVGMTQLYQGNETIPVTVLELGPNYVIAHRTEEEHGYTAVQLGFGEQKARRLSKPLRGQLEKAGVPPVRFIRELRVRPEDLSRYPQGGKVTVDQLFREGEKVDVTGTSKGRGFAGVVKRHGFRGSVATHGTHEFFRHGGSIGTRLTPGMVLKGTRMAGHMGARRVTIQNLKVVKVDADRNLLFVKGAVPGPEQGFVLVRKAVRSA